MVDKLSETNLSILAHIARYRLTTAAILSATNLIGEADDGEAAALRALAQLTEKGWLQGGALCPTSDSSQACFQLTEKAAERLGHSPEFAMPLKPEARVEAFAIAKFCATTNGRTLFTKQEFTERFPKLWYPGQPVRYYIEPPVNGPARLAFIKVDKDGAGRWDRLIDSCVRFLRQRTETKSAATKYHAQIKSFEKLVADGRFQFTVLTALPDKKRAIELELERRRAADEPSPPLEVHVVEELWEAMFPSLQRPTKVAKRKTT